MVLKNPLLNIGNKFSALASLKSKNCEDRNIVIAPMNSIDRVFKYALFFTDEIMNTPKTANNPKTNSGVFCKYRVLLI